MSRLTAYSIQKLARPFEALRRRANERRVEPHVDREPEEFERVAAYARAGYFNMGYTFEMFPRGGDLPPG